MNDTVAPIPVTRKFYAIVTHPQKTLVMIFENEQGYVLPNWTTEETPSLESGYVVEKLHDPLALNTTALLRYKVERYWEEGAVQPTIIEKVYVVESRTPDEIPSNAKWLDRTDLIRIPLAQTNHQQLVEEWLTEVEDPQLSPNRVPWAWPGWFDNVMEWIASELGRYGWYVDGTVKQSHANCTSTVLRVPTSVGHVFYKAVACQISSEAAFYQFLAKLHPENMPTLLATNLQEGWILMADFGGQPLNDLNNIKQWQSALTIYAQLQIDCIQETDQLLAIGVRDRRLDKLPGQLASFFQNNRWMRANPVVELSEEDVEKVCSLLPKLQEYCTQLATYQIPQTIDHGDFHAYNIATTKDGVIFYDWSDLMITHPFFSLVSIFELTDFFNPAIQDQLDWRNELRDAYLQPWTIYEPMERLNEALHLAIKVGLVVQVLNYSWILEQSEAKAQSELEIGLAWWLKLLQKKLVEQE